MSTRRMIDVDITDRADGQVPAWNSASGTHEYVDPTPGSGETLSRCLAQRTTNQAIGANPTALAFDAADLYDPDGWHDPSSNNTRLTCPVGKGGKLFHIHAQSELSGAAGRVGIRVNGTSIIALSGSQSQMTVPHTDAFYVLNDGDYVEAIITGLTSGNTITTDQPTMFGVMG